MRVALLAAIASLWLSLGHCAADEVISGRSTFIGWLDDDHWLAARDGRLVKVAALTGKESAFAGFAALSPRDRESLAERAATVLAARKNDAHVETASHNLLGPFASPDPFQVVNERAMSNELATPSPDGKWTALNR